MEQAVHDGLVGSFSIRVIFSHNAVVANNTCPDGAVGLDGSGLSHVVDDTGCVIDQDARAKKLFHYSIICNFQRPYFVDNKYIPAILSDSLGLERRMITIPVLSAAITLPALFV